MELDLLCSLRVASIPEPFSPSFYWKGPFQDKKYVGAEWTNNIYVHLNYYNSGFQ